MSGRPASTDRRPGQYALSVGLTEMAHPPGWCWVMLGDIARLESGHTPSRNVAAYWNGRVPWIGIKDARKHHGKRIYETLQTVSQAGLDNSAARLLPTGTVCLSRTASVGYAVVMGREMSTSQDFVNWVCSGAINPEFLMHLFIAEKASLLRFGKGTTHTTVYYPEVKAFHVCVPPKREQREIVNAIESHLTRLDEAVAGLERVQRNLKRYHACVLQAAVEGRLVPTEAELARAEGRDFEPASVLLERILAERRRRWEAAELLRGAGRTPRDEKWRAKYAEPLAPSDSQRPDLPLGWCWATVDQLSHEVRYGTSAKTTEGLPEGVPVLRMGNILDGDLDLDRLKHLPADHNEFPELLLRTGDILFNRTNSPELVGKTAVFHGHPSPCSFASYLILVRLLDGVEPSYLSHYINSGWGRSWVASVVSQQVGQANVNGSKLKACVVPLPPAEEQVRIIRETDRVLSLSRSVLESANYNCARCDVLRQSILKRAFEGKLVDQDPTDEPAAVLLERIRKSREAAADEPRPTRGRARRRTRA